MNRKVNRYIYTAKREDTGEIVCRGTSEDLARHFNCCTVTIQTRARNGEKRNGITITRSGEIRVENLGAKRRQTLCWRCGNTNRFKCPWFDIPPKPVDGWKAEESVIYSQCGSGERVPTDSFLVKECPNFVPDKRVEQYEKAQREETHRRKLERDRMRYYKEKEKRKNENQT